VVEVEEVTNWKSQHFAISDLRIMDSKISNKYNFRMKLGQEVSIGVAVLFLVGLSNALLSATAMHLSSSGVIFPDSISKRSSGSKRHQNGFVKIKEAPPKLLEARQYSEVKLVCSATGNPAPRVTWRKDGHPLMQGQSTSFASSSFADDLTSLPLGETKSKLVLPCIDAPDAGLYECIVNNGQNKMSVKTQVNVDSFSGGVKCSRGRGPPSISQWMGTAMQVMGTDARLICSADSATSLEWRGPDGQDLSEEEGKYEILPTGDLIVYDLSFTDMGVYSCVAENGYGKDMATTFLYPLAGPP
jgi:hypothetical protein